MSNHSIDGLMLKDMVKAGAAMLERNREAIDALNVFPVPDGDTGTNMSLTMKSTVKEISTGDSPSVGEVAELLSRGALKGARGNSGVILSQIFRGFARGLEGEDTLTPEVFARALKSGAETAYKAVMKPKEGTILTVARVMADDAIIQAHNDPEDMLAMLDAILESGEEILKKTPDMLPVLKQAGVVDAGGRGLLTIYYGYRAALRGEAVEDSEISMQDDGAQALVFEDDHDLLEEIHFAYCTEFIVQNIVPSVTDTDIDKFRRKLADIGDSLVVVGDFSLIKVHVHTNDPGKALQFALRLGELVNLKIENMIEQRRERLAAQSAQQAAIRNEMPEADYGMVAVSMGEGFSNIFLDLGVGEVVEGGQTMNPSIDDLLAAIVRAHAKTVFVFPNNSNIILAAQQAAELAECAVHVIPTKNVAMGIGGVLAFQADAAPEDNERRMTAAAQRVKSGQITFAVRDSVFEDKEIHEGDVIGIYNGKIHIVGENVHDVAVELMKVLVTDQDEFITVFYGQDTQEEEAVALTEEVAGSFAHCEVEMQYGGQPLYYYLFAVE